MSVSIRVVDDSSISLDIVDLFWQWCRRETANSPLDRMTAYPAAR